MCIYIYVHRRCRLGSRLGKLIRYPLSPLFAPNPPHPGGYGGLALASPKEDAHRIVTIAHGGPPAGRLSVCTCGLSAQNTHHHKHDHWQADFQSVPAGFQPWTFSPTYNGGTGANPCLILCVVGQTPYLPAPLAAAGSVPDQYGVGGYSRTARKTGIAHLAW